MFGVQHSTEVLLVSFLMVGTTIISQTLIRQKKRIGWLAALLNQVPFNYLALLTGAYGSFFLSAFYTYNAVRGLREWSAQDGSTPLTPKRSQDHGTETS